MSIKIRPYRKGGYEVDIVIRLPNGQTHRERRKSPFAAKSATASWAKERERYLLVHGLTPKQAPRKEVPTLAEFVPRYIEGYCKANGQKPSTIDTKQDLFRCHLLPAFGDKRLDDITAEDVQRFKAKLAGELSARRINVALSTLNTALKCAVEWGVLEELPVQIKRLRPRETEMEFFDFTDYDKLVLSASKLGDEGLAFVLLAGDAGLRGGEIRGMHWSSIDLRRRSLVVEWSEYKGQLIAPKYNKVRTVPMTMRLTAVLKRLRKGQDRTTLVFKQDDGVPFTKYLGNKLLRAALDDAELRRKGAHKLRHTFCSHLAMRGISARVIQQLVGHKSLTTTERYMHLAPGATEAAIAALETPPPILHGPRPPGGSTNGDILEAHSRASGNSL